MKPDMTRKEYFSPAALAGIIFIQCGPDAWMYSPRDHAWEQARSACRAYSQCDRDDAFDNYEVQLVGSGTVAGREAYVIRAAPRSPGESLHRVWVDKQCYLMLRTQVETIGGTVLSSSKFTSIAVEPRDISPTIFAVSCKAKNGVNTISLFERRCNDDTVAPRMPDKLTTVMTWARDGLLFTLVGDISRVELKKIADSVK
jgi:negative regulator of sigma E activity